MLYSKLKNWVNRLNGVTTKISITICNVAHAYTKTADLPIFKDRKPFCADLKSIYQAPNKEKALDALERVTKKWDEKYPNSMKSWKQN